jgi:hypothetical protein
VLVSRRKVTESVLFCNNILRIFWKTKFDMNVQTAHDGEDPSGSDDELLLAEDGIPLDGYDSGSDAVDGSGHKVSGHTKK